MKKTNTCDTFEHFEDVVPLKKWFSIPDFAVNKGL
jgi:hypothetical protein